MRLGPRPASPAASGPAESAPGGWGAAAPAAIAVVQHNDVAPMGHLGDVLGDAAVVVRLDRGDPVPDPSDYEGIVVLGGIMGAYDVDAYPFLAEEKAMLRKAVELDVPVLGICLGCQLLADALGGAAYRAPSLEVRFGPCGLTEAGGGDPVARHLAQPVLSLHQDTWDVPPGGVLLARSPEYRQAFRLGSAVGIQPHPEVTPEIVAGWVPSIGADRLRAHGVEPDHLLATLEAHRTRSASIATDLFRGWLASVGFAASDPAPPEG